MKLLPMNRLGARQTALDTIEYGIYLPDIPKTAKVVLCAVLESDQFLSSAVQIEASLMCEEDSEYGPYWSGSFKFKIDQNNCDNGEQAYLYWLDITLDNGAYAKSIIDPFARSFGQAAVPRIAVGEREYAWEKTETAWRMHRLNDLMLYELHIREFSDQVREIPARLCYLADLGVNAIEVMPITETTSPIDWGYDPICYFGIDHQYGGSEAFKKIVESAHSQGMAVILDVVYGHTGETFGYQSIYAQLGIENPLFADGGEYGRSIKFDHPLIQDYFFTVNHYWLDQYHVDGFRYDNVSALWNPSTNLTYYADLTEATYKLVTTAAQNDKGGYWGRFLANGDDQLRLIQCAEYLNDPNKILTDTYSNCTWQNRTLDAAEDIAKLGSSEAFGHLTGLLGFTKSGTHDGHEMTKTALQYIETHDHKRFLCNFGLHPGDKSATEVLIEADRTEGSSSDGYHYRPQWFRVQPYLIGLFSAVGIPLLWQGQELGESYYVPDDPMHAGRVRLFRPLHWQYYYDEPGRALVGLVRKLTSIRKERDELRMGEHNFFNDQEKYGSRGLLFFTRNTKTQTTLVGLNFSNEDQSLDFEGLPQDGLYVERLNAGRAKRCENGKIAITIPSNFGVILTSK